MYFLGLWVFWILFFLMCSQVLKQLHFYDKISPRKRRNFNELRAATCGLWLEVSTGGSAALIGTGIRILSWSWSWCCSWDGMKCCCYPWCAGHKAYNVKRCGLCNQVNFWRNCAEEENLYRLCGRTRLLSMGHTDTDQRPTPTPRLLLLLLLQHCYSRSCFSIANWVCCCIVCLTVCLFVFLWTSAWAPAAAWRVSRNEPAMWPGTT